MDHQPPRVLNPKYDRNPGKDDFGIVGNGKLIVSAKALAALKAFNLNYCDIAPYSAPEL